jgi:antitoxin (DNA-binding transcriptional repressor) of toxin-antitoxin stability system
VAKAVPGRVEALLHSRLKRAFLSVTKQAQLAQPGDHNHGIHEVTDSTLFSSTSLPPPPRLESEAEQHPTREFELVQPVLAKPERVAEVAGVLVAEQGRPVARLRAHAKRLAREVLQPAAEAEGEPGLRGQVAAAEETSRRLPA